LYPISLDWYIAPRSRIQMTQSFLLFPSSFHRHSLVAVELNDGVGLGPYGVGQYTLGLAALQRHLGVGSMWLIMREARPIFHSSCHPRGRQMCALKQRTTAVVAQSKELDRNRRKIHFKKVNACKSHATKQNMPACILTTHRLFFDQRCSLRRNNTGQE